MQGPPIHPSVPGCAVASLPPWSISPSSYLPSSLLPFPLPSICRSSSSEVFCFMSQLLLSFFSPSVPGDSQEQSPDILKLLAPHLRLKEHVESMATEGTSHNLPELAQVKLNIPSLLVTFCLAVLWANMGRGKPTSPFPRLFVSSERSNAIT